MINSSGGHNQFSFFNAKTGNTPFFYVMSISLCWLWLKSKLCTNFHISCQDAQPLPMSTCSQARH